MSHADQAHIAWRTIRKALRILIDNNLGLRSLLQRQDGLASPANDATDHLVWTGDDLGDLAQRVLRLKSLLDRTLSLVKVFLALGYDANMLGITDLLVLYLDLRTREGLQSLNDSAFLPD